MATTASIFSDFWNDQLVANDRQWLFLVLLGLVLSFGFIRMSTRLMRSPNVPWWPGSIVSDGGVHVHHLVFGIVLMMVAGTISFAGFATGVVYDLCALGFGIGIGLTIDEFALWVHLDDVYWAEQGRSSVDAAVIAAALMGLVLLGFRPFGVETGNADEIIATIIAALLWVVVVVISFAKGRVLHGIIGFMFNPVAIYAACRIGKPDSTWARHRYGDRNSAKQAKSEARFRPDRRTERFKQKLRDAIGGVTGEEYEARHPEP
ncbi:MAG: hypothetical protein ACXWZM_07890 [Solirubrobacterales bacterium]